MNIPACFQVFPNVGYNNTRISANYHYPIAAEEGQNFVILFPGHIQSPCIIFKPNANAVSASYW